ncbi:MAG: serine/threonine-protein kinase [Polyangiaceae bacterium]
MTDTSPDAAAAVTAPTSGAVERGGAAAEREDAELDPAEALVGATLAERYRVNELLGTGGMGAVYRAEHVHMKKSVAVKVLHREMTYLPEVVARFEREAVAAARIEHPNVAGATDFGRLPDGAFYLVLEYVEGTSLRQLIKDHGVLPVPLALHIARQMADGLAAAHAADVVHRDLKPDNVMLIEREGDPYFVKLLDFGIAKVTTDAEGPALTQLGSVFGTPEYMSPEQAAGTPVDQRSDLYTLGIMLYEMLCGQTPFDDDDLVVVLTRQMTMEPAPLPPSVPASVQALVARLLLKDPDQRIGSAMDLVQRIDGLLLGTPEPVAVSPPMPPLTPSPPSAAAHSVQYGDTVLSLARPPVHAAALPARRGIAASLEPLLQRMPALARRIPVGGHPVPLYGLIGAGAAILLVGFFLVVSAAVAGRRVAAGDARSATAARVAPPPNVKAHIDRAKTGDRQAIAALQARPETERTAPEWYALGRGLAVSGHVKDGLVAYQKALALDPALANDSALLKDVLRAAETPATVNQALDLGVASLGANGADLVYEVYQRTRGRGELAVVSKAAKAQLEGAALRAKASPALLVVLDLNKARGCAAIKPVIARAAKQADARASTKLKALSARRGCGFFGMGDCYSCLRGNSDLSDAIKRAGATPAPRF